VAGDAAAGLLISLETVERAIEIEEWFIAKVREAHGVADTGPDVDLGDVKAFVGWLIREHANSPYQPITLSRISRYASPRDLRQASYRDPGGGAAGRSQLPGLHQDREDERGVPEPHSS